MYTISNGGFVVAKYVIKDSERGKPKCLSDKEATVSKSIKMTQSMFDYVNKMGGSKFVRKLIDRNMGKDA